MTCKTVCNEVFNILQDIPTLFDCRHDGCEIVIGQDHARGFLTDIRTCNTHSYSHICGFQSRSVIYSVSRHCNYVSLFLEGLNHFQLVFWIYPCVDRDFFHYFFEFFIVKRIQFDACEDKISFPENPEFLCNRKSRGLVVARNHHGPDSCTVTGSNRSLYLLSRRVTHTHKPCKNHFFFSVFSKNVFRNLAVGKSHNPKCQICHVVYYIEDFLLSFGG